MSLPICNACGQDGDEDLSGFDPTKEGGGGPCQRCGQRFEPWVYAIHCQACTWDMAAAASEGTQRRDG